MKNDANITIVFRNRPRIKSVSCWLLLGVSPETLWGRSYKLSSFKDGWASSATIQHSTLRHPRDSRIQIGLDLTQFMADLGRVFTIVVNLNPALGLFHHLIPPACHLDVVRGDVILGDKVALAASYVVADLQTKVRLRHALLHLKRTSRHPPSEA